MAREHPHLALVGMMAVGKTTAGRILAARRHARFVDTDEVIEAETGRTVRELWEEGGEAAYRARERAAVVDALASTDPLVLAVPGGVVVDPAMAATLVDDRVIVVHLRAAPETLARRVTTGSHRPLLGDDPSSAIAALARERAGRYEELADLVVDVDDRTPEDVAAAVLSALDG